MPMKDEELIRHLRKYLRIKDQIDESLRTHDQLRSLTASWTSRGLLQQLTSDLTFRPTVTELSRLLEDTRRFSSALDLPAASIQSYRELFRAALNPLLDPIVLTEIVDAHFPTQANERVNEAISDAPFLADVAFESEDEEDEESAAESIQKADECLIEIVPATTLENLRQVDFAPLTVLNQVLRNPRLMQNMDARDFEGLIATLLDELGFQDLVLTPRSGDKGRTFSRRWIDGIPIIFAFECKRYRPDRGVGPEIARALLGTILSRETRASKGVLVTTSYFTRETRRFILTEPALDGKDFDAIVEWLNEFGSQQTRDR